MKNFGKIKNLYNGILTESIRKDDISGKESFKKYVKTLRENEILKTQFLVYTNIESKIEQDPAKATQYIQENISLFDKFSRAEIEKANALLSKDMLFTEEYSNSELHENISKLIFIKKTPSTINERMDAQSMIVDYITTNKELDKSESVELPLSLISTMMVDKFNSKYDALNESNKQILRKIIDSTDTEKQEIYTSTIRECVDLIDSKLSEANLDEKDRLLRVKDKLLRENYVIDESFIDNISKLVQLKESLSV